MGWSDSKEVAKEYAGSGFYQKLANDKDKFVGVPLGEPDWEKSIYDEDGLVGQAKKTYRPGSAEYVKLEKAGIKPRAQFKMFFLVFEEGNGDDMRKVSPPAVRQWQFNATVLTNLEKFVKKVGINTSDLPFPYAESAFEVERQGAAKDPKTQYSFFPIALTDAHRAALKKAKLPEKKNQAEGGNAEAKAKNTATEAEPDDFGNYEEEKTKADGPISADEAKAIVARIKALPDAAEKAKKLLGELGLAGKRVADIQTSQLAKALSIVDGFEGKAPAGDEDPF